jgi:Na+-driven multidrug efflux pump
MAYHCILAVLIWPLSFTLPSALRAANDVKFTMWVSMLSMWIWRIALSYILAIVVGLGVLGIWIAMTIDWLFRSIFFVTRFLQAKYKTMNMT